MIFKGIKKILVIKLRHIGDVLLSLPVFRALKQTFPDSHISALVNSGTEEALAGSRYIDDIIVFDRDIKEMNPFRKYACEFLFLKRLREGMFDMTLDLTGGDRAALASFLSGARYRLGWKPNKGFAGKKFLYTDLSEPDGSMHIVMQNLSIASHFGISTTDFSVDFHIPEADRHYIKQKLEEHNIGDDDMLVHLHPTSRWLFKCWKDEYTAEVTEWLINRGIKVIFTSSSDKKELDKAKRILSLCPSLAARRSSMLLDLCGRTTIKQLGAISERANLFFGVDSAPMHISAAVKTPVVALFGPSGAYSWGPWDNKYRSGVMGQKSEVMPYPRKNGIQIYGRHIVIQKDWECIPCGKDGCGGTKKSRCLEEILPEDIKRILSEKLWGGETDA